jgi:hypothetical protein
MSPLFHRACPFECAILNFGQECKLQSINKAKTTFSSSKRFVLLSNLKAQSVKVNVELQNGENRAAL